VIVPDSGYPEHATETGWRTGVMMPKKDPGPTVKDKKLYERLRDEGISKQKAARIANAAAGSSRRKVAKKGGRSPSYDDWSLTKLHRRARQVGIKGRSATTKRKLIKALRRH